MTHYFQNEYVAEKDYIEGTTENYKAHTLQPVELEAYTVDAYYFLNFYNKKALRKTLNLKLPKFDIFKALMNEQIKIQYPNNKALLL